MYSKASSPSLLKAESCSRSITRCSISKHSRWRKRNWEDIPDYPDYDEILEFNTSDIETQAAIPATRVMEVTADTQALLTEKFAARSEKGNRLKVRNAYTLARCQKPRPLNWMGS